MAEVAAALDELAVLQRLLALAMSPRRHTAWEQLVEAGGLYATAATYFLLDVEPQVGVEEFAGYTLGRLLQQLSHKTEQLQVEYRGLVRGRIIWVATYKARFTRDVDPARYVCREVRQQYDTPENQLLKYVIERIDQCVKGVPEVLRSGMCYFPAARGRGPSRTADRLGNIAAGLSSARRNVYLRDVTLPQRISDLHLSRAETAEMDEYRAVARIYRRYDDIVASPAWHKIAAVGKHALPLPGRTGVDGELWLRLGSDILLA